MVAIANRKVVIKCHHYNDNVNAETFGDFVKKHFPEMFKATREVYFCKMGAFPKTF